MAPISQPNPKCAACWFMRGVWTDPQGREDIPPRVAAFRRLVAVKLCLGSSSSSCPLG